MPRRAPPSSLRLFAGPLPPRSQPKHTLPSVPRPVFRPEASPRHGPTSVPRTRHHRIYPDLPPLELELAVICGGATPTSSPTSSRKARGPWDDSSCIDVAVDVDSVLAPPKPVAMGI